MWLPRPVDEVFAFFADAMNLETLTPPWLKFTVLTPKVEMRVGALIDYRLKVRGLPVRWRTEITAWEPTRRFVDEQLRGPYRLWRHEHTFRPLDGGTVCGDVVEYRLPGIPGLASDPVSRLVHGVWVRPDLERIFDYRRDTMLRLFGESAGARPATPARAG